MDSFFKQTAATPSATFLYWTSKQHSSPSNAVLHLDVLVAVGRVLLRARQAELGLSIPLDHAVQNRYVRGVVISNHANTSLMGKRRLLRYPSLEPAGRAKV